MLLFHSAICILISNLYWQNYSKESQYLKKKPNYRYKNIKLSSNTVCKSYYNFLAAFGIAKINIFRRCAIVFPKNKNSMNKK